jgi:hypothetical protein
VEERAGGVVDVVVDGGATGEGGAEIVHVRGEDVVSGGADAREEREVDVEEREVRSGGPGMHGVHEGGGRTGPRTGRSPPRGVRGGGAPRVLGGDGGGRLDAVEVGLDCALDGGELDVVGAAHSLFFRGKKTVKSFWRLFYVGRFFFFAV